jgi:hypothetical protein
MRKEEVIHEEGPRADQSSTQGFFDETSLEIWFGLFFPKLKLNFFHYDLHLYFSVIP